MNWTKGEDNLGWMGDIEAIKCVTYHRDDLKPLQRGIGEMLRLHQQGQILHGGANGEDRGQEYDHARYSSCR